MALYLIGDVQGCDDALGRLFDEIAFSASRDTLVLLGDLVKGGYMRQDEKRRRSIAPSRRCRSASHSACVSSPAISARWRSRAAARSS